MTFLFFKLKQVNAGGAKKRAIQADVYLGPSQTSTIQHFCVKIVNCSIGVFRTESNIENGDFGENFFQPFTIYTKSFILDVRLRSEYASGTVNYFCKKLHLRCLTPFGMRLWNS